MNWLIWLIIGIVLIMVEIYTPGFFILWFGVSAIITGILVLFGVSNIILQLCFFVFICFLLVTLTRKFANVIGKEKGKVGPERLLGKTAYIIQELNPKEGIYLVKICGEEWIGKIEKYKVNIGESLKVIGVEGNIVILEKEN